MANQDILQTVYTFLSNTFGLPGSWFGFPQVIFFVAIPVVASIFMWYNFLHNKLHIFRSQGVNIGIAFILSVFSLWIVVSIGPLYSTAFFVLVSICVMGRFTFKRLVGAIAITVGVYFALALLMAAIIQVTI